MNEKRCNKCGVIKPVSEFCKHTRHSDGLASWCSECSNKSKRDNYANRKTIEFDYPEYKTCKKCLKTKPAVKFTKNPLFKDGLDTKCMDCMAKEHSNRSFARILNNDYISISEKKCSVCKETKPISFFSSNRHSPDKYRNSCRECENKRDKERKNKKEYRSRNTHLKNKYGITEETYIQMLKDQNGVCAICGKPERNKAKNGLPAPLYVDHSHSKQMVRKLLCSKCNSGLGMFYESKDLLRKAIAYLDEFDSQ